MSGADCECRAREIEYRLIAWIQCLTCGARNEHSTRGCPISKVCYSCGMKGHINKVGDFFKKKKAI